MQDATAQMALLQFMTAGLDEVAAPTTVHCDHLIQAKEGAGIDLKIALTMNDEVYDFLRTVSARYGIGFWKPGSGIIHQVVLENYAFPGGMMIGTDSHTPNAGGLGMVAIGVGGADAVDVMTGFPFNVRWPKLIGVHLTGELSGWSSPKDVILKVAEVLTVEGGTGAIVEYFGPGADTISATGKGTICNMGAEIGATTSLFAVRPEHGRVPQGHRPRGDRRRGERGGERPAARPRGRVRPEPVLRPEWSRSTSTTLEPLINGPHTPDLAHKVSEIGADAKANDWPLQISSALVGSCTNSSYEDITRAASIARQASAKGLTAKTQLLVTPGSEQVRATIERDGLLADLEAIGATVLANACGPCIGQWDRTDMDPNDAQHDRQLVQPQLPEAQRRQREHARFRHVARHGHRVRARRHARLRPPHRHADERRGPAGEARPARRRGAAGQGLRPRRERLPRPARRRRDGPGRRASQTRPACSCSSPSPRWDGKDLIDLPVLMKAKGKCTTDHISAAGKWLTYRGHLENISGNLFLGVVNAFTGATGEGKDQLDGATRSFPDIAKHYAEAGVAWCAVGDQNYGEGSSREHAAMEPRFRNGRAIFARSFARIHDTNLKKQGLLPLTFADPATYDQIGEDDRISVLDLASLAPDMPVRCSIRKPDGSTIEFFCNHTFSDEQIEWFKAGSALNIIRARKS